MVAADSIIRFVPLVFTERRPVLLEYRSSKFLIFSSIVAATFTDLFLYGVIIPVVPFALENRVGISPENVQHWVSVLVAIYGVFLFVGCPTLGYLSDLFPSRRWPYLFGLVVLAVATGLLCDGRNLALWVVGRALQGIAGSVVCVTGTALLVDTVGKHEVGHYLGYQTAATSIGILMGPLLGGIIYARAGYYAVFGVCFGIIAVDIVLRFVIIEKSIARRWLDPRYTDSDSVRNTPGEETTDAEQFAGVDASSTSNAIQTAHKSDGADLDSAGDQSEAGTGGVPAKKRSRVPPVISFLKSRRLLAALYGSFVQAVVFTAFDSTLPLFVQGLFGWTSLGAGIIFLPLTLPAFASPVVGYLSDKSGPRWLAAGGFLVAVPPLVLLRLVTHDDLGQKVLLCAMLALTGLAITASLPSLSAEIAYILDKKEAEDPGAFGERGAYAQGFGLFWMAFAAGCLVGPLWGGLIRNAAGWGTMTWTLALLSGTTSLPIVLFTGGWILETADWKGEREKAGERAQEMRGFA